MKIDWCKIFGHKLDIISVKAYSNDSNFIEINLNNLECKRCSVSPKELSNDEKINISEELKKVFSIDIVKFSKTYYKNDR